MFMQQKYPVVDEFVRKKQNLLLSKCGLLLHKRVRGHHTPLSDMLLVWFMEVRLAFKHVVTSLNEADHVLSIILSRLAEIVGHYNFRNSSTLVEDVKTLHLQYTKDIKTYMSDVVFAYVARGISCKIRQTAHFVMDTVRNTSTTSTT